MSDFTESYADFYTNALADLTGSDKIALIVDTDSQGNKVPESRILWLTSLALDQGLTPVVARLNSFKYYVSFGLGINKAYIFIPEFLIKHDMLKVFN